MAEADIHAVAGLLKLYLRDLPEPLFTDDLYPNFVEANGRLMYFRFAVVNIIVSTVKIVCSQTLCFVLSSSRSQAWRNINLARGI